MVFMACFFHLPGAIAGPSRGGHRPARDDSTWAARPGAGHRGYVLPALALHSAYHGGGEQKGRNDEARGMRHEACAIRPLPHVGGVLTSYLRNSSCCNHVTVPLVPRPSSLVPRSWTQGR